MVLCKAMIRRNFLIREDQDELLKQLPGNSSENVRSAIDMYLKVKEKYFVSASSSKGGDK